VRPNVAVLVAGALIILPLVVVLASGFGKDPRAVPSVLENKPAPTFELVDMDGKTWSLAALRGKPVVLNFWATWCLPCKTEYAGMQRAAQRYPTVQFLGVVFSDEEGKARAQLARETIPPTYPNLVDPGGRVAIDYGVAGVPETYFIAADGVIAGKYSGPLTDELLVQALGKP
jgi:cytochrome c biogenesis protein CcmG/thiol:disulfide interchange protein DsbE